jgi:enamine deaminase RidA (YjgF/YER057c/UK114 family)
VHSIARNPTDGVYSPTASTRSGPRRAPAAVCRGDQSNSSCWRNIRSILGSAGMTVDKIVRVTSYLRERRGQQRRASPPWAPTSSPDGDRRPTLTETWLVEVEVIAAA